MKVIEISVDNCTTSTPAWGQGVLQTLVLNDNERKKSRKQYSKHRPLQKETKKYSYKIF